MPQLHLFNHQGELVGPVTVPALELTEDEWRARLTPEQFRILRAHGTERAFCGTLLDNKTPGVYACAGCRLPLFTSDSKFHSGTGWPSFFQAIAPGNVAERADGSFGMVRVEILCGRCGGHLGHVFDDGPRPTGLRYCLNSESLDFTPADRTADLADPAAELTPAAASPQVTGQSAQAVFAGGCFWCTEAAFEQLVGVSDVESGYCGGSKGTANYKAVCGGDTQHAEVIRITYDPGVISLDTLLNLFFDAHDPTQLNRQGNDVGTQYRSAVFYADSTQKAAVEAKIATLNASGKYRKPIVTTLEPLTAFYPAEAYHQDYARHNPTQPYIQGHAIPKACQLRARHPELFSPQG
ncbi:MAG: bifunctional methionine sulfoxide reductase B/A protein [Planctomycetota bacterium]|nr:bifunctional methionine sulfoxide reductase B/A protein [Planctomycetota bacterium]